MRKKLSHQLNRLGWLGVVLGGILLTYGDTVVVPNDRLTQSGDESAEGITAPGEFQEVFGGKNFAGAVSITGIAFRLDEGLGGASFDTVIPRVVINLSTYGGSFSTFAPSSYLPNLAVFDGSVHWTTSDLVGPGPNPFDLKILFSRPFVYDPAKGSLLMHFVVPQQPLTGLFVDGQSLGDATIGWIGVPGTFVLPPTKVLDSIVTQFQTTQVPEPGAVGLFLLGALILFRQRARS